MWDYNEVNSPRKTEKRETGRDGGEGNCPGKKNQKLLVDLKGQNEYFYWSKYL